jgi:dephospho-CoA kinase
MNIAFCGGMGSGKTTAASYLSRNYGFSKLSLAAPIKFFIRDILEIDKTDPSFRNAAQQLGGLFREFDKDCWTKYLLKTMGSRPIVIDDARYGNEVKLLLEHGFHIIYLVCPSEIRASRCLTRDGVFDKKSLSHESEIESVFIPFLDEFYESESAGRSKTVLSDTGLEHFENVIDTAYHEFIKNEA